MLLAQHCPTPFPAGPMQLFEERVMLFYSQTAGHCWRSDWGYGNLLSQTCCKGKICEISEYSLMRFPFLQPCWLQQPSAGFCILPNPSSHGSNKGTSISIRVTMETKRSELIMVKNNSGGKKNYISNLDFSLVCSLHGLWQNVHQPTCQGHTQAGMNSGQVWVVHLLLAEMVLRLHSPRTWNVFHLTRCSPVSV